MVEKASDRIRDTAKWTAVSFGAVAAVLVGGLQLTGLKDLTGDARTHAQIAYYVAVAGALLVILAAAVTQTAGRLQLQDLRGRLGLPFSLRRALNKQKDLYAGEESIDAFVAKVVDAMSERTAAWKAWQADPNPTTEKAYKEAIEEVETLMPGTNRLLEIARYEHLRRTWKASLFVVIAGGLAAAGGVAVFAAQVGDAPKEPAKELQPVMVRAALTQGGWARHQEELGADCRGPEIVAALTAAKDTSWTIFVIPTPGHTCGPASLELMRKEGSLRRTDVVAIDP
ncbi:MAG: hypothetical protein JWN46_2891 [Acidimicrobiales bacterium]|nr:hypothetical protein [Acidimicrobiales bacterium]